MRRFPSFLVCFVFGLSLFLFSAACGQKSKSASEEAARKLTSHTAPEMLFSVSIAQLLDKSGVKDGSSLPPFSSLLFGEKLAYLQDENKSGIRFSDRLYVLTWFDENRQWHTNSFIFGICHASRFATLLEKEGKGGKATKKNGFRYLTFSAENVSIAWNEDYAIAVRVNGESEKNTEILLWEQIAFIQKTPEKTDSAYLDFFAGTADICWFRKIKHPSSAGAEKMESRTTGSLHFETDRIVLRSQLTQEGAGKTPIFSDHSVPEEYLGLLSDKGLPWGFATASVPLVSSFGHLKGYQPEIADSLAAQVRVNTGLALQDLMQWFSGDFALSFAGMDFTTTPNFTGFSRKAEAKRVNFVFHLTAGLLDEAAVKQVLDTFPNVTAYDSYYRYDTTHYLVVKAGKLFISNSESQVRLVAENGMLAPYLGSEKANVLRSPFYAYFDFNLLQAHQVKHFDKGFFYLLEHFDYLRITGNNKEALVEFQLNPDEKNALSTLVSSVLESFFEHSPI